MALIHEIGLDTDALAYRLFGVTRDKLAWRVEDILREGTLTADPRRAETAWRQASHSYYSEQAGLIAAARLAAGTEDAMFRFGLALAVADEARHADAFCRYARAVGGGVEDCLDTIQPLDDAHRAADRGDQELGDGRARGLPRQPAVGGVSDGRDRRPARAG